MSRSDYKPNDVGSPSPAQSPTPGRLEILGRAVLTVCILVVGWWTAQTYRDMVLGNESDATVINPVVPTDFEVDADLLNGGGWTFAGIAWKVNVDQIPTEQVAARLSQIDTSVGPFADSESSQQLVALLNEYGATTQKSGDHQHWTLRLPSMQVAASAQFVEENPRFTSLRLAIRRPESTSIMLAAVPQPTDQQTVETDSLLPQRPTTQTLCRRIDAAGRVLLEATQTRDSLADIVHGWENGGWKVEMATESSTPDESTSPPIVCRKGGESVLVWISGTGEQWQMFAARSEALLSQAMAARD